MYETWGITFFYQENIGRNTNGQEKLYKKKMKIFDLFQDSMYNFYKIYLVLLFILSMVGEP